MGSAKNSPKKLRRHHNVKKFEGLNDSQNDHDSEDFKKACGSGQDVDVLSGSVRGEPREPLPSSSPLIGLADDYSNLSQSTTSNTQRNLRTCKLILSHLINSISMRL